MVVTEKPKIDLQYVENTKKRKRKDFRGGSMWDLKNIAAKKRKLNDGNGGNAEVVKVTENQVSNLHLTDCLDEGDE